jgi:hypothetical protein
MRESKFYVISDVMVNAVRHTAEPHVWAVYTDADSLNPADYILFPHANEDDLSRIMSVYNQGAWSAMVAHNSGKVVDEWPTSWEWVHVDGENETQINGLTIDNIDALDFTTTMSDTDRYFNCYLSGWKAAIEYILNLG